MLSTIAFILISAGVIVSSIGVVRSRSAIYAVLWLVAAMCFTAVLFVLLGAYLVAAVQVLVYAGAILVLFLFIVMLMDLKQPEKPPAVPAAVFAAASGLAFLGLTLTVVKTLQIPAAPAQEGTAESVGRLLFSQYVLPFEL